MQKKYLYIVLFILVALLIQVFCRKIEYLTIEEVDEKIDRTTDRIEKLEDDYSSLHTTVSSQEDRMSAATSQATEAKAFLNTPTG
jgi:hypothetical protein